MAGRLDSTASRSDDQPAPLASPIKEGLPILLVDDRPENLVALEAVLAPLALPVVTAGSGEEALRLLLERDFSLILLDVRMPHMDGIETARMIKARQRTRDVPIVFLTAARDEVTDIVRGYAAGAIDYVLKPVDEELLRTKVAVFVELEHRRLALRHSEGFLRSAFEAAPIGKTLLDVEQRVIRVNKAFARLLGYPQDALAGKATGELCHPEDRPGLATVLGQASADPAGGLELDVRLIGAGGRAVWVAPTASLIEGTEPGAPLLLVQWVDVSARRRGEQTRADLMLEQAARLQAEEQAERLAKLQQIVEALDVPTLDALLTEVARRLLITFDAVAAEVRVNRNGGSQGVTSGHICRADGAVEGPGGARWREARLMIDGTAVGALRVALAPTRSFSAQDRALLLDAADHIALQVRRTQLHEREHRIAVELQQGLLPAGLPEVPGVEITAHYEAAGLSTEVGGDWYDAFTLPEGRLGLVVGDVTGSGIRAASAMGQLRSVTRAFALEDHDTPSPSEVLTRLHRYHQNVGFEQLFTVLYLILDAAQGTVSWANAGHPPPLLRTGSGKVRRLHGSQSLMSIKDVAYEDHRAEVSEGDTLILYTDGLIERRGEPIDAGVGRLEAAIRSGPEDPEELCTHLLDAVPAPGSQPDDDVTALVVRISSRDSRGDVAGVRSLGERVRITVAPDEHAPALARRLLQRSFGGQLVGDELDKAKLAISELTTNAVIHGHGEITLLADLDETRLLVEVIDQGSGFEHAVRERDFATVGGRGLSIVDAESSRWGMSDGTTRVWFEIERHARQRVTDAPRTD